MAHTSRDNSEQDILNSAYDDQYGVLKTSQFGSAGDTLQRANADNLQIKSVASGGYTYFCFAAPGTAEATAKWRCFRIDGDANLMFADGDSLYNNVATDPTALDYKYA